MAGWAQNVSSSTEGAPQQATLATDEFSAAAAVLATTLDSDSEEAMDTEQHLLDTADVEDGATAVTATEVSRVHQPAQLSFIPTESGSSPYYTAGFGITGDILGPYAAHAARQIAA